MSEGCPVDLRNPQKLHNQLTAFLDRIGQDGGEWTEQGGEFIPAMFIDCQLARDLERVFKDDYTVRVTERVYDLFANHGNSGHDWLHDLVWMLQASGFEFACGWRVFPVIVNDIAHWLITGMLFPDYGEPDWVVFALLDEVLPVAVAKEVRS
jgi:hypothetical protein